MLKHAMDLLVAHAETCTEALPATHAKIDAGLPLIAHANTCIRLLLAAHAKTYSRGLVITHVLT